MEPCAQEADPRRSRRALRMWGLALLPTALLLWTIVLTGQGVRTRLPAVESPKIAPKALRLADVAVPSRMAYPQPAPIGPNVIAQKALAVVPPRGERPAPGGPGLAPTATQDDEPHVPFVAPPRGLLEGRLPGDEPARMRERWIEEEASPEELHSADEMMQDWTTMLEQLQIDGEVEQVSCRATVCLGKFMLAGMDQLGGLGEAAGDSPADRTVDVRLEDTGQVHLDVYVPRRLASLSGP
ncbi:MAG: hypothetical protein OXR73_02290 [Myxococcales bacterium]|nr:hypothetical protein [Myxococcales bacterium]